MPKWVSTNVLLFDNPCLQILRIIVILRFTRSAAKSATNGMDVGKLVNPRAPAIPLLDASCDMQPPIMHQIIMAVSIKHDVVAERSCLCHFVEEYSFSATHSAIIVAIAIAIFTGNANMLTSMHPSHN